MEAGDSFDQDPDFATREERAAAADAASIGGRQPDVGGTAGEPVDEASRPVREAGGGEQEGFEVAENDLVRNASHDDGEGCPERDAFSPEHEADRSTAEDAQADEEVGSGD